MTVANLQDMTVLKNIPDEVYEDIQEDIQEVVDELFTELLGEKASVDIDEKTLLGIQRNDNDLTVWTLRFFNDSLIYHKKRTIKDWF